MEKNKPLCSVIILNYFGENVIGKAVDHLLRLNYPSEKLEIIIVDNASKDRSRKIIKSYTIKNKNVKSIFLDKNLGFSGGNNVGIKASKGKYVILLNNDCFVQKDWLDEMVKLAENDPKVFAINPKILLYPKFYYLNIKIPEGVAIDNCFLVKSTLLNFTKEKRVPLSFTIKDFDARVEIPHDSDSDNKIEVEISLTVEYKGENLADLEFTLSNEVKSSTKIKKLSSYENKHLYQISVDIERLTDPKKSFDKIQNAGIIVFQDGYGRDVGSVVKYQNQEYELDLGQYDKAKEIYAANGAALLLRREILNEIGLLDEYFFMYYEDVDISERARIHGYKLLYCPRAVVRHLHAFSSKEGSSMFIYHAAKGRFLHMLYNFPLRIFVLNFIGFIFKVDRLGKSLKSLIKYFLEGLFTFRLNTNPRSKRFLYGGTLKMTIYMNILLYFIIYFPILVIRRLKRHGFTRYKDIDENYKTILEGTWYFD